MITHIFAAVIAVDAVAASLAEHCDDRQSSAMPPAAAMAGGSLLQQAAMQHTHDAVAHVGSNLAKVSQPPFTIDPNKSSKVYWTGRQTYTHEKMRQVRAGRPWWYKTLRCTALDDMSTCEECFEGQDCWKMGGKRSNYFKVEVKDGRFVRHLLSIHLSCPQKARISYKLARLQGGTFRALWDWKYNFGRSGFPGKIRNVSGLGSSPSSLVINNNPPLRFDMAFTPDEKGGHELVIEFVHDAAALANGQRPKMRLGALIGWVKHGLLTCMDTQTCYAELTADKAGQQLRQLNGRLRSCLGNGTLSAAGSPEDIACKRWINCLVGGQITEAGVRALHQSKRLVTQKLGRLYLMLKALGEGRPEVLPKLARNAIRGSCIDPYLSDPLQWSCDCDTEIKAHTQFVSADELDHAYWQSIRRHLCDRDDICLHWKEWACKQSGLTLMEATTSSNVSAQALSAASSSLTKARLMQRMDDRALSVHRSARALDETTTNKKCP